MKTALLITAGVVTTVATAATARIAYLGVSRNHYGTTGHQWTFDHMVDDTKAVKDELLAMHSNAHESYVCAKGRVSAQ